MAVDPLPTGAWGALARGAIAYAALILFIRITGNRTLAKLRAFDFVVTIAMGGVLASIVVDMRLPLHVGVVGLATLIAAQWAVAASSARVEAFGRLVTNQPVVLYREGAYREEAMRKARVTREEIHGSMRSRGFADEAEVGLVLLETNGELSVLGRRALADARHPTAPAGDP